MSFHPFESGKRNVGKMGNYAKNSWGGEYTVDSRLENCLKKDDRKINGQRRGGGVRKRPVAFYYIYVWELNVLRNFDFTKWDALFKIRHVVIPKFICNCATFARFNHLLFGVGLCPCLLRLNFH